MGNKTLGDRMKKYEAVTDTSLINQMPVIIRVDGRAFHSVTRGMGKPFDDYFIEAMNHTMKELCEKMQNVLFAYCQSDEISLAMYEKTYETASMFNNRIQKLVSTASAIASVAFTSYFYSTFLYKHKEFTDAQLDKYRKCLGATFDARAFNVPRQDVANYFLWRQNDCYKNAINTIALTLFSTKELNGKNQDDRIRMITEGKDFDLAGVDNKYLLGRQCRKVLHTGDWFISSRWTVESCDERFTEQYLEPILYGGFDWYKLVVE